MFHINTNSLLEKYTIIYFVLPLCLETLDSLYIYDLIGDLDFWGWSHVLLSILLGLLANIVPKQKGNLALLILHNLCYRYECVYQYSECHLKN